MRGIKHSIMVLFLGWFFQLQAGEVLPADSTFHRRFQQMAGSTGIQWSSEIGLIIREELYQNPSKLQQTVQSASSHLQLIAPIVSKNNVPAIAQYLPVITGFNPLFVSPQGGSGLWNLPYLVAVKYGLKVNETLDERRDPLRSSMVAVKWLRDLHLQFQDWSMAFLAFLTSPADVVAASERTCKKQITPMVEGLSAEKQKAYYRFSAGAYLLAYAPEHGLAQHGPQPGVDLKRVKVTRTEQFPVLAQHLHTTSENLHAWNPMYRSEWIPGNQGYEIFLPEDLAKAYEALPELPVSQESPAISPVAATTITETAPVKSNPPPSVQWIHYKVKPGDNLGQIASKYRGVTISELKKWNNLRSDLIRAGQVLRIRKNG